MSAEAAPRRRKILKPLLVVAAFHVGVTTGLYLAGGGYLVYAVPTALFDWPRLWLGDIVGFFIALFD